MKTFLMILGVCWLIQMAYIIVCTVINLITVGKDKMMEDMVEVFGCANSITSGYVIGVGITMAFYATPMYPILKWFKKKLNEDELFKEE